MLAGAALAFVLLWTFGSLVGGGLTTLTPGVLLQSVLLVGSVLLTVRYWWRSRRLDAKIAKLRPDTPKEPPPTYDLLPEAVRVR